MTEFHINWNFICLKPKHCQSEKKSIVMYRFIFHLNSRVGFSFDSWLKFYPKKQDTYIHTYIFLKHEPLENEI